VYERERLIHFDYAEVDLDINRMTWLIIPIRLRSESECVHYVHLAHLHDLHYHSIFVFFWLMKMMR